MIVTEYMANGSLDTFLRVSTTYTAGLAASLAAACYLCHGVSQGQYLRVSISGSVSQGQYLSVGISVSVSQCQYPRVSISGSVYQGQYQLAMLPASCFLLLMS